MTARRPLVIVGDPRGAAMCVAILEAAGLEPGFCLPREGGEPSAREPSARRKIVGGTAKPPPFVVDAAAFDATTEDVRELVAVIGTAPPIAAGLTVCDARSPHARALEAGEGRVTFYGLDGEPSDVTPEWLAAMAPFDPTSGAQPFDVYAGGSSCGRFAFKSQNGADSVRSAVAAIAACAEGFGVHVEKARQALAAFANEGR